MSLLSRAVRRGYRIAAFVIFFGYEFVAANAVVAWEILSPGSRLAPAIVTVELRCRTRLEIVSLANLVSLTPGTLTLEIQMNPPTLFVHGMHAGDVPAFRHQLRVLEDRLLAALRPVQPAADSEAREVR